MSEDKNLEEVIKQIDESTDYYVKNQKRRIFLTVELAKTLHVFDNAETCLVVGGGEWNVFNDYLALSFPNTKFINSEGDLHNPLQEDSDSFDSALCTEVFEHIGDRNFMSSKTNFTGAFNLISQITRVLKISGRCLMSTPNAASLAALGLLMRGCHPFMYPLHYREYTRYEIERILRAVGVQITYFDSHFCFMADEELKSALEHLLKTCDCPTNDRGDNFFVVFQKPATFSFREPVQSALEVYPQMRREPMMPEAILKEKLLIYFKS